MLNKIIIFCLSTAITSGAFAYVEQKTDPCNQLSGQWRGFWSAPYSRCHWTMDAKISQVNSTFTLEADLKGSGFPNRCGDATFKFTGECVNGEIKLELFNRTVFGNIKNNTIEVRPTDEFIHLEKVNK